MQPRLHARHNMWPTSIPLGGFNTCRGCDHPRPAYDGRYGSIRTKLGTMLSNAKFAGCETCDIFSQAVLKFCDEDGEVSRDAVDELRIDFNMAGTRRSIELVLLNTPVTLSFFCSERTPWIAENLPDLPLGADVPPTTAAEESVSWAIRQLEHCKQNHDTCGTSNPALPRRVLDVFADAESGVRLYESNREMAPYTCLSHCWGRKPFLRTLSGSLDAHKQEISWSRLPRTFQDVVGFTRRLGIRYLWIDSLCIVQDDQSDWRREAAEMASIYRNATLVISAARSQGANEGLYADVTPLYRTHTIQFTPRIPGSINYHNPDDGKDCPEDAPRPRQAETIHFRRALVHPQRVLSPYHPQRVPLPVFTRGWILQERLLSLRILHFAAQELHFECLTSSACQCSAQEQEDDAAARPAGAPAWYNRMLDRSARPKRYYSPAAWRSGEMTADEIALCWRRLVEDYTRLRLTFDKDVFPAISGLARQMRMVRRPGARYLAGLWLEEEEEEEEKEEEREAENQKETETPRGTGAGREGKETRKRTPPNFIQDLLWHIEIPPQHPNDMFAPDRDLDLPPPWTETWHIRPDRWRAPSWSWAAVKAPVSFLPTAQGVEPSCTVLSATCAPAGPENPLGELVATDGSEGNGNYLVIRGRVVPAMVRYRRHKKKEEKKKKKKEEEEEEEEEEEKEEKEKQIVEPPWNLLDLDVLDGGYLKNLWADDDCRGLLGSRRNSSSSEEGEGGFGSPPTARVYVLLVGRKLPMRELLCLVLARTPRPSGQGHGNDDDVGGGTQPTQQQQQQSSGENHEDPYLYRRIGLLEIFGGPPSPVPWGWVDNLLGKGEDKVIRII